MRVLSFFLVSIPCTFAFAPLVVVDNNIKASTSTTTSTTQLFAEAPINRRQAATEALLGMTGFVMMAQPALALNSQPADNEIVKEQRTVVDKLDINNAAVADYMQFPGMYPTIGGKIANNGPYDSVKDVYKLKLLSKAESNKFKEYEKEFTATPSTGLDTMRGRDPYRRNFNK